MLSLVIGVGGHRYASSIFAGGVAFVSRLIALAIGFGMLGLGLGAKGFVGFGSAVGGLGFTGCRDRSGSSSGLTDSNLERLNQGAAASVAKMYFLVLNHGLCAAADSAIGFNRKDLGFIVANSRY